MYFMIESLLYILYLIWERMEIGYLEISLTLFTFLLIYLAYSCFLKPKREIQKLKRLFEEKGFRVYSYNFNPFGFPQMDTIFRDTKVGDSFKTCKEIFPQYDVAIGNYLNRPSIQLLSP